MYEAGTVKTNRAPLFKYPKTTVLGALATAVGAGYLTLTKDFSGAVATAKTGVDLAQVYGEASLGFAAMVGLPMYLCKRATKGTDEETSGAVTFYGMTALGLGAGLTLAYNVHMDVNQQARLAALPVLAANTYTRSVDLTAKDEACQGIDRAKRVSFIYQGKEVAVNCPAPVQPN